MKTVIITACLAAVACAPAAVPPPATPATPAMPEELEIAGVPVIFKPVSGNDIVALRLYVRGGSANLQSSVAGIERFLIASATRGTEKYDKDQFAQLATRTGASFGGSAEFDFSVFTGQGVRQHWEELWDLFTQAVLHPTLPAEEVETVRGQLLNAVRQLRDNPDSYLTFLGDSVIYAGHPYASLPGGTEESLAAITRDALAAWHRDRLTRENLLLVVVGNVSRPDLEQKIAATFGRLPETGSAAVVLPPLGAIQREVVVVRREVPTNYIAGFYAAPPPSHADYPAFVIATHVLSDRLFEEVRTKRNLSYAAFSTVRNRRANLGFLYVTTVHPDSALRVMLDEVHRLQREPIAAERLAEVVNVRLTVDWLQNETNMNQAARLGLWELAGGGWENALRYPAMTRAVSPEDVQRVAQRYLRNARFVFIGPDEHVNRELLSEL